jgi:magnesium-protoporphyrin IX monomethyl ester (oxidative) cyclase
MDTSTAASIDANESTNMAKTESLLSPRFYTTNYKALDKLDVTPVRAEWEEMMEEFERDVNHDHFTKEVDFDNEFKPISESLYKEFQDFLVSSITAEYSGCVLYQEIRDRSENPDVKRLMAYMTRDEARHAGFINKSLKNMGIAVDLGFLKRAKKYTYFKPKYIFYATYLSEKIGYARYITIFRHLERNPDKCFHPIFKRFLEWCNDEYRHGEAFALMMKSNPHLVKGLNVYWVRFLLLAVYATMYIRDHTRPQLYEALGLDPTEFDYKVFDITSEISKQIFPVTLDVENVKFRQGLEKLREVNVKIAAAKKKGGLGSLVSRLGLSAVAGITFAKLYFIPVNKNELPKRVMMAPSW